MTHCNVSFADGASRKQAEILLKTMGTENLLEKAISQQLDVQISQNPSLIPYKQVMIDFFRKYMSYQSLKPELLKIYAETFTAQELREVNAFYTTTTGQKAVKKMPELLAKASQLGATRIKENIQELQNMIKAETARIEAVKNK